MSGARRRIVTDDEEQDKAQPGSGEAGERKRTKLPPIPWTLPVLVFIAIVRYRQVGDFDFLSFGAAALVAMRLGSWISTYMSLRRGELDEDEIE